MKVIATDKYEKGKIMDAELRRIPIEGEEFEISEERYNRLSNPANNPYGVVFVVKKEEKLAGVKDEKIETAKKEPKTEKAVRKTTKKTK